MDINDLEIAVADDWTKRGKLDHSRGNCPAPEAAQAANVSAETPVEHTG